MDRGEKIGEGTYGIVYTAMSPSSKREYAVKRNIQDTDVSFIGVSREVDILNKLRDHPHIITLQQVSFGTPFTTDTFSPLLGDRKDQKDDNIHFIFDKANIDLYYLIYEDETHGFNVLKKYMVETLLALEYIHAKGIIHRDLKPANILIFNDEHNVLDQKGIVKICDFGMSKPNTNQGSQTPNTVTAWYRAPEVALEYGNYSYPIDIWSLGCIFFEMISGHAFIDGDHDNNDKILIEILTKIPKSLELRTFRELIKLNPYKQIPDIKSLETANSKPRKDLQSRLGLTEVGLSCFKKEAGSFISFCDLLSKMLCFDWRKRITATECLNHPFFITHKKLIAETRRLHKPVAMLEKPIKIHQCIERKWMVKIAIDLFNSSTQPEIEKWYSDRILFHAMSIFDRFLYKKHKETEIPDNAVESEYKGLLFNQDEVKLMFYSCLYLCHKYFSSVFKPSTFVEMLGYKPDYSTMMIVENFEGDLILNYLKYEIYRMTVYEAADLVGDLLQDNHIRDLVIIYCKNNSIHGKLASDIYKHYKDTWMQYTHDEVIFTKLLGQI